MPRVIVIGAGIGGLACAIELAIHGVPVTVLERASTPGGKMRRVEAGGRAIDSGPTVLTMRQVFEQLFARAGARLGERLGLEPLAVLARHAWPDGRRLDLFCDLERTRAEIERAFGRAEADGYRRFCAYAARIWATVEDPFMRVPRPGLFDMVSAMGVRGLTAPARIDFRRTMWHALGDFFAAPQLRQLFARYATYFGSDPFRAPATLNLIAHVEREGVWVVRGGMFELAVALVRLAGELGVEIEYGCEVREIVLERGRAAGVVDGAGARREARAVVVNADPWAIADGHFGASVRKAVDAADRRQRSLSAITWAVAGRAEAFPLLHHNVFFSSDYALEFEQLGAQGRVPSTPTVYLCAQHVGAGEERGVADRDGAYLVLVNAPPRGDEGVPTAEEQIRCRAATFALMQACGLTLTPTMPPVVATPRELAQMFPGTGGALYGPATHGWRTPFSRPGSRTRIAGLYLAGGGTHPGAGVPLVALSGRFAAQAVAEDLGSTRRSRPGATSGGTSTSSPRTGDTR